jgi:MEDS: MEthanogen/methylotroph, DcmR Sensory domain
LSYIEKTLDQALRDSFSGLWASGDMALEFGPKKDFSRLLEYEWQLERFFREHPQLVAVCQYHVDALPREALRTGAIVHETIFVNETLSVPNPKYIGRTSNQVQTSHNSVSSSARLNCRPA